MSVFLIHQHMITFWNLLNEQQDGLKDVKKLIGNDDTQTLFGIVQGECIKI